MFGNRVPGLNRPNVLPSEGPGMVSKSHLTVRPVANDSVRHHSRGESQSLGSGHRRFTSQSSHSALTSPSLSAYDGEGGVGLSEVDEFGGLNGFGTPQTPYSPYSPASTFSSSPSPEVTAIDKLPGKLVIPNKFQRRVVSDSQANYGFTRTLTPDPEMPLQPLEEEVLPPSANAYLEPEAESTPEPQTQDDPKEPEIQPPAEQIPELQVSNSETPLPPSPTDSSQGVTETAPKPTSPVVQVPEPISESSQVAGVVEEEGAETEDNRRSSRTAQATQDQDRNPVSEVSKPNPISFPLSPVMDSADASASVSPKDATSSVHTPAAGVPPVIEKGEQPTSEKVVLPVKTTRDSDHVLTREETPGSPALAFPLPPINASHIDDASSQLQTPPESPNPASSIYTSASDLSDSTVDYQSGSSHPDPDHDLFVLPLPKDDELPLRSIVQEAAVPQSMHQVLASPLPTPQTRIDFPTMAGGSTSTTSSDPNVSFAGDESLALDASQAEIVIAQSEVIRPASPTLFVAMPTPSPTTTTFRVRTPPPPEESLPPLGEANDAQVSPPRIRKKLYTNHSVLTSFKDSLSSSPPQHTFSAVVHQKTRSSAYILPSDTADPPVSKPSKPTNAFMTPKKKQSLFAESMTPASPGSDLAFLMKNAAILEAQLGHRGDSSGDEGWDKPNPTKQSAPLSTGPPPRSALRSGSIKVKSASTPALVSTSVTTLGYTPPVPDLVYDDGSSNSGLSLNPQIPSFLPQSRSRKSGAHEEADRKSLAPSHKSRKSEKSAKEKDKDSMPRARKLSSRLRSLASSSSNSLKSFGRPSMSSETSVSFDGPATVSVEPMTPQNTGGGESGRLTVGFGSPGSRSQTSQGSGSEWNSPPRGRHILGRASSFADRLLSRAGKTKSGFLDNSQGNASPHRHLQSIADTLMYRFGFERLFESDENEHGLWQEGFS